MHCYNSAILLSFIALFPTVLAAQTKDFDLPIDCEFGKHCFVQQGPDVQGGPDHRDPLCGQATYDGHSGWDIRVRWMPDLGLPVLAARDGVVVGRRDEMPDRIVRTDDDRAAVSGRECGNGLVIAHADGWTSQYCHLQRGSVRVKRGDSVEAGDIVGAVGASGLAQFPHIHFSVKKDGNDVDPLTGHPLGKGSCGNFSETVLTEAASAILSGDSTSIIASGISWEIPDNARVLQFGAPPPRQAGNGAFVAWAWAINLEEGWRVRLRVTDKEGEPVVETETSPLDRNKADFLAYGGRRDLNADSGTYTLEVSVIDGTRSIVSSTQIVEID